MKPKPEYDRLAGGKRKAVQLLVPLDQHALLCFAAGAERTSIAQFVLTTALREAGKIRKKISTKP